MTCVADIKGVSEGWMDRAAADHGARSSRLDVFGSGEHTCEVSKDYIGSCMYLDCQIWVRSRGL